MFLQNGFRLLVAFFVVIAGFGSAWAQGGAGKKIVFVAGKPSHAYAAHEHNAGCLLLAKELAAALPNYSCATHHYGWPEDPHFFDGADCLVMYCDGGEKHMVNAHLEQVDALAKKGVGIVCIHYAVEVPAKPSGEKFLDWIGGYFEAHWSVNPHWTAKFEKFPEHPIARGVQPFEIHDEWYYHMRFREGMQGVTPILTALPTADTLSRADGPHQGNPHVRAAVLDRKEPQHVAWAAEREGGGRGFGFTGGHDHWNWGDPNFRKLVLNAVVWCAKGEVPASGVGSPAVTLKELEANLDPKKVPPTFDREKIREKLKLPADQVSVSAGQGGGAVGRPATTQGGRPATTEAQAGGAVGRPATTEVGRPATTEVGRPATTEAPKASGKSVPPVTDGKAAAAAARQQQIEAERGAPERQAKAAVAGLDVAPGLEATLFASEPEISNISNIDIDAAGRVWACDVQNYRWEKRKLPGPPRAEGDRILVLEDSDGDGKCDKQTVFYQGRDIDSAHGICVLGNRVIVSALDKVHVLYDENGDLKADEKRDVLFSGISGAQHDHGIHAFIFGPDGKLYFNFGNAGEQLKDKNGKPIVDLAGNEVHNKRKPYQEGMVFRCNLDGSQLETLAWNFRNNWELAVDSFGTIWQSDNDDDGNKGVRINYVMEFGNYGFKDELTGAAWKVARENLEKEVPLQHWHLNDPGVVPTMLITGAGSPTGICFYEGTLLPKIFQNQVIHCDAGPNICRAYVTKKDGAGYTAEMVNILDGAKRDNWFRPSDVCVAPDGSLFIADWYDPGVGGHNQQDVDRGRIFRVAPPGAKYSVPKSDFSKPEDAVTALQNPCLGVRYLAFAALHKMVAGEDRKIFQRAAELLDTLGKSSDIRVRARAMWCVGTMPKRMGIAPFGGQVIMDAVKDSNPNIRILGIRLARHWGLDDKLAMNVEELAPLAKDPAPEVRRELALALRHSKAPAAAGLWADLAMQHDGNDRWYLEALGIAADKQWDAFLDAFLAKVSDPLATPAGRAVIWRSRAKKTPALLVKIIKDPATSEEEQKKYFRALDFLSGPEKETALKSLLE